MGATPALLGVGTAVETAGQIAGGKGGEERPVTYVPPEVQQALRTGLQATTEGLQALPTPSAQAVQQAYEEARRQIEQLRAPEPTVTPEKTIKQITEATVRATAPLRAERERAYRETAGAYGPTALMAQTRAGEVAQTENELARLISALTPELQRLKFQQQLDQLRTALGLTEARVRTYTEPFTTLQQARLAYLDKLLGTARPATERELGYYTPAWASTLRSVGRGIYNIPTTLALLDILEKG